MPKDPKNQPRRRQPGVKRPYRKPEVLIDQLFERHALGCNKTFTYSPSCLDPTTS